jgi:hypothetical protein
MKLQLYVVFHKVLFGDAYERVSADSQKKYLRFFSVNSRLVKYIPSRLQEYLIVECNLAWYNAFLQFNRFFENSALIHAAHNPELCEPFDYVGFCQYDMRLSNELFETVRNTLMNENSTTLFYHKKDLALEHILQVFHVDGWKFIINRYNTLYGTSHIIEKVLVSEIPLYNTFILPREVFKRMMSFSEMCSSVFFEFLQFETKHLPYHLERLHGVFLLLQTWDGLLHQWVELPGIEHDESLKEACQAFPNAVSPDTKNSV